MPLILRNSGIFLTFGGILIQFSLIDIDPINPLAAFVPNIQSHLLKTRVRAVFFTKKPWVSLYFTPENTLFAFPGRGYTSSNEKHGAGEVKYEKLLLINTSTYIKKC